MAGAVAAGGSLDLPADMQRELRELTARESGISHYELLGLRADADGGAVRRAYLERSKRFHPDAWFTKTLGEFAPLLLRAFQRISAAYQVLADDEQRANYDQKAKATFSPDERAAVEKRLQFRADEERRALEGRARLLRMKGFARIGAARRLYEEAVVHGANGQRGLAIEELKTARELDPLRKEIALKLAELEKEAAKARVAAMLLTASNHEIEGELQKALSGFTSASQMDPTSSEAAQGAARCALAQGEHQLATTWAQRAAERAPAAAEPRLLLARAFSALKMKARAKAELQVVLGKHPNHAEAKSLLKSL